MTDTTTPLPNEQLMQALRDRIGVRDEYARQLEEAVRTWETLDQSPQSLLDANDTVLLTETPSNLPWPTRPVPAPQLADVLSVLPEAIVLLDAQGCITYWNRSAEEIFGWRAHEVLGKPPPFVAGVHSAEHHELLAAARNDSPIRERIVSRRTRDDRTRVFSVFSSRTASGDVAMTFRAVEPAKAVPVSEVNAPRLEALGQMVASVSHDFNNVLSAICGSADLLAERTPTPSPNREWIEIIRTAGRHATGLTKRLVKFARPAATASEETDLSQTVEELLPLVKALVPAGVRVKVQLEPNLPMAVVDATALEQVILNLSTNAGQAMPRGGVLQLHTGVVLRDGHRCVVLAVADSGTGMDDATRARLFEPYFTTRGHGTGLGLATVREIVTQAGGDVELETHPGLGSVFRIVLPASAARSF